MSPARVSPVDLSLAAAHEAVAAVVGPRDCIVWRDRRWSWSETTLRTRRLAAVLGAHRIGWIGGGDDRSRWESPHEHLALYLLNGPEYLEGTLGAAKARAAAVNVNYRYVAHELAYLLENSHAAAVAYHGRFAATLDDALDRLGHRPRLLLRVDDGSGDTLLPGALDYEEALAAAEPRPPDPEWSADDRYLLYTGGTTGQPKGVLWRQGDFLVTCLGITGDLEDLVARAPRSELRALPAPPLMHGAALWNAMSAWLAGGTVVIQDVVDRLDAADLLDSVERHGATSLLIVGDAFARPLVDELRRRPRDLSRLRHVVTGGAVLSPPVRRDLLELVPGLTVVDVLGSSETGRQGTHAARRSDDPSGGSFTPSGTTVLLDETRSELVAPGQAGIGWLAQRGRVPLGYLGDRVRTEATFPVVDGERLAVAGDRARWSADGALELLGRDAACINTGGEKVFAEEVERALAHHPAVADCLVVGRPHPTFGAEIVAVVATRAGAPPTLAELRTVAGEHLARYKLPRDVVFVDAVMRSPSGKPDYAWARGATGTSGAGRPP